MSLKEVVVAIDVGGTTIKAGLVNRENEILARQNFNYVATNFDAEIQECVKKLIKGSKEKDLQIIGLSVGLPEYIKNHEIMSNMVVNWNSATTSKIKALVGSELGHDLPILIESDVRCGARDGGRRLGHQHRTGLWGAGGARVLSGRADRQTVPDAHRMASSARFDREAAQRGPADRCHVWRGCTRGGADAVDGRAGR